MKIVLTLISHTMYILWLIRWEWLLCFLMLLLKKRNHINLNLCNFFELTQIKMHNIFSLDLFKTYAVLLHWDRQCSWGFYIFEWDTQIWYTKIGNLDDDFMFLINFLCVLIPGFKEAIFVRSIFSAEGTLTSASMVPHGWFCVCTADLLQLQIWRHCFLHRCWGRSCLRVSQGEENWFTCREERYWHAW